MSVSLMDAGVHMYRGLRLTESGYHELGKNWPIPGEFEAFISQAKWYGDLLESSGGPIVEIGVGNGRLLSLVHAATGLDVIGIDIDPEGIEVCHEWSEKLGFDPQKVRFEIGSAMDTGLPSNSCAGVIINLVISHVKDDVATLKEAARILKPGGQLVMFEDNNSWDLRGRFRRRTWKWPGYRKTYLGYRKSFLQEQGLEEAVAGELAEKTEGYAFPALKELSQEWKPGQAVAPIEGFDVIDPRYDAFGDKEFSPTGLLKMVRDTGLKARFIRTHYGTTSRFARFVSGMFRLFHPLSIPLSPSFTILGQKP